MCLALVASLGAHASKHHIRHKYVPAYVSGYAAINAGIPIWHTKLIQKTLTFELESNAGTQVRISISAGRSRVWFGVVVPPNAEPLAGARWV